MESAARAALMPWESFYVIVGSAAAALTGLQFVVIVLIAQVRKRSADEQIATFGTPTVVHFGAALLLAAMISAPWPTLAVARVGLVLVGAAGLGYAVLVTIRACRQTAYQLVMEDWCWHMALPLAAYASIAGAGMLFVRDAADALFVVGAMALLLLFIGIHNAWDTVAYIAAGHGQGSAPPGSADEAPEEPADM